MFGTILSIALGGAFGAVARYGVNAGAVAMFGPAFPWGTLAVNIGGSFLMGVLISVFAHFWQPDAFLRSFLIIGFLGAFTTFSAFSLDFVTLWERGDIIGAGLYAVASVVLSIAALFGGMFLIRSFTA
jgi:CrcB protein